MSNLHDCPGREAVASQHCWHRVEQANLLHAQPSVPIRVDEICCWCGAGRVTSSNVLWHGNHGPFIASL